MLNCLSYIFLYAPLKTNIISDPLFLSKIPAYLNFFIYFVYFFSIYIYYLINLFIYFNHTRDTR